MGVVTALVWERLSTTRRVAPGMLVGMSAPENLGAQFSAMSHVPAGMQGRVQAIQSDYTKVDPIAEAHLQIGQAKAFKARAAADPDPAMARVYKSQVSPLMAGAATSRRNAMNGTNTSYGNDPANIPPSRSSRPRAKK